MADNRRPETMERITTPQLAQAFIDEQLVELRRQIGDKKVLLALSGGVDSSVVAALLIKAVASSSPVSMSITACCARASRSRWWKCSATRWTQT